MSRFIKFVAEDSRHNLAKESDRSVVIVVCPLQSTKCDFVPKSGSFSLASLRF